MFHDLCLNNKKNNFMKTIIKSKIFLLENFKPIKSQFFRVNKGFFHSNVDI